VDPKSPLDSGTGGWRSVAWKEEAGSNRPDKRQARLNGVAGKRHGPWGLGLLHDLLYSDAMEKALTIPCNPD